MKYREYIARYYASHDDIPAGHQDGEIIEELVRCKDCKHNSPNGVYGCRIHSFDDDIDKRMYADDYCSRAERRKR